MKKIIEGMLNNRLLTIMIVIFVFTLGILSMNSNKREELPQVSLNMVTITTIYPGASPEDVELNVTIPIENEIHGISGIKEFSSFSTENYSVITVKAEDSLNTAEMQKLIDDIKAGIDQVEEFPSEIQGRPAVKEINIQTIPIIELALIGDHKKIRLFADKLSIALKRIKGVGKIDKVGHFETEVHIEVNPWKLDKHYISFDELINSIQTRNIRASGGSIDSFIGRKSIVTLSKFKNLKDVSKVIIRSNFDEKRITVKDIANIKITEEDNRLEVRNNGKKSISLVIAKKTSADQIDVIDAIKNYMKTSKIPKGISYEFINDTSRTTRQSISSLLSNATMGITIVILVLMLFLNLKTALWCSISIPFSIIAVFIFLPLFGITINNVMLMGFLIVIGMLVSAAIVTAEHIESYQEKGMTPFKAASKGALEMVQPVSAAVLTTIASFIPLLFLGGMSGKFVVAIPVVVTLTLLASLVDAFLILPSHLSHGKKHKVKEKAKWIINLENKYKNNLSKLITKKKTVVSTSIILLFGAFLLASNGMKVILFPNMGSDVFYIKYEAPVDVSLEKTSEIVQKAEKVLIKLKKKTKEISSFSSRIGHNDPDSANRNSGDHVNWAVTSVFLTSADKRDRTTKEIMEDVKKRIKIDKKNKIIFEELKKSPSREKPISIIVMGNNEKDREMTVKKILKYLKTIKGISDLERDDKDGKKQLVIKLDYTKLAAYGLNTASIASIIRIAYDGHKVTSLQTPSEEIWYRLILDPKYRRSHKSIGRLKVRNRFGNLIELSKLIKFESIVSKQDIFHYEGLRSVTINGEVDNKNITAIKVAQLVQKKIDNEWNIPLGTSIEISGEAKESMETMSGFLFALVLAVCAIFFIVALVLKNLRQTLWVMSLIPLSFIGVTVALFVHGLPYSMFSMVGILGLTGIVVNDSIVMLDRLNENTKHKTITKKDVMEAAATRLRPIMMTTLTTVGALIPAAYGIGGSEPFLMQMSTTIGYGLLFCSSLTLILIPTLFYSSVTKKKKKKKTTKLKKA